MRLHIVSLPHTQTTKEYCWCAYTSKVLRFCNMMTSLGHEVFLYGGTQNEAQATEFVTVVTDADRQKWFGHYDWDNMVFGEWDSRAECWSVMNQRAAEEIEKRKQPGDILGIISGRCQEALMRRLPDMRAVEWGIGYEGIIPDAFHVFESNPWMHYVYGAQGIRDGRFFDTVIPNAFDEDDYIFKEKKDDYLLYLGRMTPRKGMSIIQALADRGHKILTAGQGDLRINGAKHMGVVRGKEKAELLANAKAVLVPTLYIEPFGGVAIEAMLSGTPVITTDFGAFTETVDNFESGIRCATLRDFEAAVASIHIFDSNRIRLWGERYTTKFVRREYDSYLQRLSLLDEKGWYS